MRLQLMILTATLFIAVVGCNQSPATSVPLTPTAVEPLETVAPIATTVPTASPTKPEATLPPATLTPVKSVQTQQEEEGIDLVVLIDTSESMNEPLVYQGISMSKLDVVKRTLPVFLEGIEPPSRVALSYFNTNFATYAFSTNMQRVISHTHSLNAEGWTDLNAALTFLHMETMEQAQRQLVVLLVSDGLPSVEGESQAVSMERSLAAAEMIKRHHAVQFYSLWIGRESHGFDFLNKLCGDGQVVMGDPCELRDLFGVTQQMVVSSFSPWAGLDPQQVSAVNIMVMKTGVVFVTFTRDGERTIPDAVTYMQESWGTEPWSYAPTDCYKADLCFKRFSPVPDLRPGGPYEVEVYRGTDCEFYLSVANPVGSFLFGSGEEAEARLEEWPLLWSSFKTWSEWSVPVNCFVFEASFPG